MIVPFAFTVPGWQLLQSVDPAECDDGGFPWQLPQARFPADVHAGDAAGPPISVAPWQYTAQLPPLPAYAGLATPWAASALNVIVAVPPPKCVRACAPVGGVWQLEHGSAPANAPALRCAWWAPTFGSVVPSHPRRPGAARRAGSRW